MTTFVSAIYHAEKLMVEYTAANGDRCLRSGGSISWRFNNPGNMRPPSKRKISYLAVGETKSGKFCIFESYEAGWEEKRKLLKEVYSDSTIPEMMERYAPRSENDTDKYASYILTKSSVPNTKKVGELSEDELTAVMEAMKQYEGYNAKLDTRKEEVIKVATIGLTDGSKPIPGREVTVKQKGQEWKLKTNQHGQLPPIPFLSGSNMIEVLMSGAGSIQQPELIAKIPFQGSSCAVMLTNYSCQFSADTQPHASALPSESKKAPVRYVIQPGDTLASIAKKFKTSVSELKKQNNIKNSNKIYAGKALSIYGSGAQKKSDVKSGKIPVVRSNEGMGSPLAIVPSSDKRAPWMEIALGEFRKYAGKKESEITKSINYHKESGVHLPSLAGDKNPGCASCVSWCLLQAGFSPTDEPARAKSFSTSKNFVEVKLPIYGSIAVFARNGGGHVCFVYARSVESGQIVVLGGNQSDAINFLSRSSSEGVVGYYVPVAYEKFAATELPDLMNEENASSLNKEFGQSDAEAGAEV